MWFPIGTQEDVELAVGAARKAYTSWSKLPGHVRARHMYSIARHVQKHARWVWHRGWGIWLHGKYYDIRLISVLESMDNGKSIRETRDCDIPIVARHFYHHSGITLFPN